MTWKQQIKPRVEDKKHSDAECSGAEMCKDNIIKILHKHKVKTLHWLIAIRLQIPAGHAAFIVHIT